VTADRTRIYLLRHGDVDPYWRDRIYGCLDIPLSDEGRAQARRQAEHLAALPLALVVSSGLARTEFGAACLRAQRGAARVDDPELRELDRGAWAGMALADLEREQPGAWSRWYAAPAVSRPPGGESLDDLAARVLPRLRHWAERHIGATIALVTHGWVIRVAVLHVLGLSNDHAPRLDVRTGDLTVLDWPRATAGELRLQAFGLRAGHRSG
jgi:broad specificity phosphatase PhoE